MEIGWSLGKVLGPIIGAVCFKFGGYISPFLVLGVILYVSALMVKRINIKLENKDIILNIQDVEQLDNLESQENRIRNVIKLSNFVQILSMSLIFILVAAVLSFSIFFLRSIFSRFWHDIQVKKLL